MGKRHWLRNGNMACPTKQTSDSRLYGITAERFVARFRTDPDRFCTLCAKAARLALAQMSAPQAYQTAPTDRFGPLVRTHDPSLAKESAPKPSSRCATSGCGSYAINPGQSGRDNTSDLNLCDVCYWRKRAESATWPKPRPISEAPKDGTMVLIQVPAYMPQWTIGLFDRKHWIDLCGAAANVEPTHFLPLPPEVM